MSQYITNATLLTCDKGSIATPISVTSQSFMSIDGKLQATEEDKQANINIKSFGICSVLRSSCMPLPVKWNDTSDFEIEGKKELLDCSTCQCAIGGKISVIKSPENFVQE